jgi:hypothetical protein
VGGRCRELRLCVSLILRVNLWGFSRCKRVLIGCFFYGAILRYQNSEFESCEFLGSHHNSLGFSALVSYFSRWVWMSSHAWRLYMEVLTQA